jgi:excinuclease Cho
LNSHRIDIESLNALPRTSGVYIFRGDSTLPLYVGKSVDIRSRVLAHLRASDEARMVAQARRVDFIETAGEIGALLLEARLIKELSPLFNIRLRRSRGLCTLQWVDQAQGASLQVVSGRSVDLGRQAGLYGLFGSVRSAHDSLRQLADTHGLCLGLLGLERIGARGCFGLQLKTCLGACAGLEPRAEHDQRLRLALQDLQVHAWPYDGPIDLIEQRDDWQQRHRILNWRHLGTLCSRQPQPIDLQPGPFDLDTYKILVKPILLGQATLL